MPKWVSVEDRLPMFDIPYPLWGDKLDGLDHPLSGCLCGCHGHWVLDNYSWVEMDAEREGVEPEDARDFTKRMLGNVTHWLEWSPPPVTEDISEYEGDVDAPIKLPWWSRIFGAGR